MIEWIVYWIDILIFWRKKPFFVYFTHFVGTNLIRPVSQILWLSNSIIVWIESPELILNWILGKQYWIKYWIESFFSKI